MNRMKLGIAVTLVILLVVGLYFLRPSAAPVVRLEPDLWQAYRGRFVTSEGRAIDPENGGVSHSESQGYGMLLAQSANDAQAFALIWDWTRAHLQRSDHLFYWRYDACPSGEHCISDENDASDGDILIAWSLLRAADGWNKPAYRDEAKAIITSVKAKLVVQRGERTLLLPGEQGFVKPSGLVVNLSYWIFPAFADFARQDGDPVWSSLIASGYRLIEQARFGSAELPPDWLRVDGEVLGLDSGFPPRYGFDAVRVPLYLIWSGAKRSDLLAPLRKFWVVGLDKTVPAWIDLTDGERAPFAWQGGMAAIAKLAQSDVPPPRDSLPRPTAQDGYYSASLILLSRVAAAEILSR